MMIPFLAIALLLPAVAETGSTEASSSTVSSETNGVDAQTTPDHAENEGGTFIKASAFLDQDVLHASSLMASEDVSDLAEALRAASKKVDQHTGLEGLASALAAARKQPPGSGGAREDDQAEIHVGGMSDFGGSNFGGFESPIRGQSLADRLEEGEGRVGDSMQVGEHRMSAAEKLAKEFQFAMVRIQSISEGFNWFKPFFPGTEEDAVGSGFCVMLDAKGSPKVPPKPEIDPVFVTNAHVVRNAHTVRIQLPAMGQQDFAAYVPLIFDKLDLALVRLEDPQAFLQNLKDNKVDLKILPIKEDPPMSMGMEVAALGFPLGTTSLKISRGVIAGTEQVSGKLCYQSTAPISPGSSGGPLFAVEDMGQQTSQSQVIGVNFAASSSGAAQNNNYVVPLVHIRQLLNEYIITEESDQKPPASVVGPEFPSSGVSMLKPGGEDPMPIKGNPGQKDGATKVKQPSQLRSGMSSTPTNTTEMIGQDSKVRFMAKDGPQMGQPGDGSSSGVPGKRRVKHHYQMRIAPILGVTVESNELLYNSSNGCKKGVFLAKIPKPSVLEGLPEQSFLTMVDGAPLDKFGMGRHEGYLDNPLPFRNLMALQERLEDDVVLTVCKDGKETQHTVTMTWDDRYELGVPVIEEPLHQAWARDFEVFAGVTVAEMTANHIQRLINAGADPRLGRFMDPEARKDPRLLVVHSQSGTYASHVLEPGMIIERINGRNISNLKAYRNHFMETFLHPVNDGVWELETDQGVIFEVHFGEMLLQQRARIKQSPQFHYLATPAIQCVELYKQIGRMLYESQGQGISAFLLEGFRSLKAKGEHTSPEKLTELIKQAQEKRMGPDTTDEGGSMLDISENRTDGSGMSLAQQLEPLRRVHLQGNANQFDMSSI